MHSSDTTRISSFSGTGFLNLTLMSVVTPKASGIMGSVSMAERAAARLSGSALGGLSAMPDVEGGMAARVQSAVESALGGIELVVPLNVDGMKLGEASIRGINAVTKSAGRVLLNI